MVTRINYDRRQINAPNFTDRAGGLGGGPVIAGKMVLAKFLTPLQRLMAASLPQGQWPRSLDEYGALRKEKRPIEFRLEEFMRHGFRLTKLLRRILAYKLPSGKISLALQFAASVNPNDTMLLLELRKDARVIFSPAAGSSNLLVQTQSPLRKNATRLVEATETGLALLSVTPNSSGGFTLKFDGGHLKVISAGATFPLAHIYLMSDRSATLFVGGRGPGRPLCREEMLAAVPLDLSLSRAD